MNQERTLCSHMINFPFFLLPSLPKWVHKYFDKKTSEWNILDFLNVCEAETLDQRLDCYVKSLKNIINSETGFRRERAQILLDNYKKASMNRFFYH